MPQKTGRTEQDMTREANESLQEADKLARRLGEIDDEIEAERSAISSRRVAAAKRGESPLQAADRDRLKELLEEKDELPELHFAARLQAAGSFLSAEHTRIQRLENEREEAAAEAIPLVRAAREAAAKAEVANQNVVGIEGELEAARARAQRHEDLLRRIESEGVRTLD